MILFCLITSRRQAGAIYSLREESDEAYFVKVSSCNQCVYVCWTVFSTFSIFLKESNANETDSPVKIIFVPTFVILPMNTFRREASFHTSRASSNVLFIAIGKMNHNGPQ